MSRHTEIQIQNLCTEALAAKTEADIERILPQLRMALEQHIKLAKSSLQVQAGNIAAIAVPVRSTLS